MHDLVNPYDVYIHHVQDRKVIYLDLCMWIELRDAETEVAKQCRVACTEARNAGRAVFPLSYACRGESLKDSRDARLEEHVAFLDALSGGVAYRLLTALWRHEADAALPILAGRPPRDVSPTLLYTYVGAIMEGIGKSLLAAYLANYPEELHGLALRAARNDMLPKVASMKGGLEVAPVEHGYHDPQLVRVAPPGPDATKIQLRYEQKTVFDDTLAHVSGSRNALPLVGDEPHHNVIARFVEAMPSWAVKAEMRTHLALSQRPRRTNDFWDLDHAAQGGAYANVFATSDGYLGRLMCRCKSVRAKVVEGSEGLLRWLQDNLG
jgi:hypothetical protein